LDLWGF